jgi:outer membrane PBP1 activator LpoA protein
MKTPILYRSQRSLVIVFLLLLGACTSSPSTPQQQVQREPTSAADWLQLAQGAAPAERASYQLKAAQLLQQQGEATAAEEVLQSLASEQLPATAVGDYLGLKATLLEQQQGSKAAIQWLNSPEQKAMLRSATPQQQAVALTVLAELQDQSGLYAQAMNTRLQISKLLGSGTALADNQEAIWQSLMQTPNSSLQRELEANSDMDPELRGWYELAVIANLLEGDIDQQVAEVEQWQRRWPSHPAALTAPAEIDLLMLLAASKPSQIAVFLPMQGQLKEAGHALRDGMLKAYFDGRSRGVQNSPLVFYDTEVHLDMAALYRRAVENGAELIIGPLKKNRVDALLKASSGLVPILALNYAADDLVAGDNFYQFGLSNEDEAVAAAERAWHKGYNRALVIQGSDSQSTRSARAFAEAWDEREGITVDVLDIGEEREASNRIKQGLHIDLSQQRARALESATGTSLQYNPRRRQDIDIVYLPVSAQQARSIKPLLAFHFAQDLPVYANSRIYRGKPDPRGDTDLNGVFFTDTPWSLENSNAQQTIDNYIERGGAPSKNLYAMGIDAYQLAPRLPQILYTPGLAYRGMTGTLTLSGQGIVLRRPGWAVFRNGIAEPIDEDPMEFQDESMDAKTAESRYQEPNPTTDNRPTI